MPMIRQKYPSINREGVMWLRFNDSVSQEKATGFIVK
jgi:hypothetical protein